MIVRVIDTETTGMEPFDNVVEIAAVDLSLDREVFGFRQSMSALVHPVIPIPPEASAVHHITNPMVADAPAWGDVWPHYLDAYHWQDVDVFAAHRADFEGMWISEEMRAGRPMICTYKCALRVFPEAPGFSNQTLRYWLDLPVGAEAMPPHRAFPDAVVTGHLLAELAMRATLDEMLAWSSEPALLPRIGFGKHRGERWDALPDDYLEWMVNPKKNDLDEEARWNAQREIVRRYVAVACKTAAEAETLADLRFWFAYEKERRLRLGIREGSNPYLVIAEACTARKSELVCDLGQAWPPTREVAA